MFFCQNKLDKMKNGLNRNYFSVNNVRLSFLEWGKAEDPAMICVHGLTGSAQDFKFAGEYFAARGYRVLAIDMPGRGESDFLENPDHYNFNFYIEILQAFLKETATNSCIWLGVSMGGLLGIRMAELDNTPIQKMILVDIGPEVPQAALDAISFYLALSPVFETMKGVIGAFKQSVGTPFYRGEMTEDQWLYYASSHVRQREDGSYIRSFDPIIAPMFRAEPLGRKDLWMCWDRITQPVLSIRGGLSELFTPLIMGKMKDRKNGAAINFLTIPDCGHVPSLYPDDQLALIQNWLKALQAA